MHQYLKIKDYVKMAFLFVVVWRGMEVCKKYNEILQLKIEKRENVISDEIAYKEECKKRHKQLLSQGKRMSNICRRR